MMKIEGEGGAVHSFAEDERESFCELINHNLKDDEDVKHLIPLNPSSDDLFAKVNDGIILCKMINKAAPNTIFPKAINKKVPLNVF